MHKYLLTIILGLGLTALGGHLLVGRPVAAQTKPSSVMFNADGTVNQPDPHVYRRWVFVGAPLTPEGLNNGKFNCDQPGGCTKSNFPEYHHVYIEQKNVDAYLKTGEFPEGTVVVKELTRVLHLLTSSIAIREDLRGKTCVRVRRMPYRQRVGHRHDLDSVLPDAS